LHNIVTLEELSLLPARGDNDVATLCGLELATAACCSSVSVPDRSSPTHVA
jgi:hypothetical protein